MTKICTACKQELPATSEFFYVNKAYKMGLRSVCKECQKAQFKAYKGKNAEKIRDYRNDYYQGNPHYSKEYITRYRKDNAEKYRKYAHERESKKRNLLSDFTEEQWEGAKRYFDNKCAYCGKEKVLTQDHVVPLSKGGNYTAANIIPACSFCNSSKSNQDMIEWYRKYGHYNKRREQKILTYLDFINETPSLSI